HQYRKDRGGRDAGEQVADLLQDALAGRDRPDEKQREGGKDERRRATERAERHQGRRAERDRRDEGDDERADECTADTVGEREDEAADEQSHRRRLHALSPRSLAETAPELRPPGAPPQALLAV